MIEFVTQDTVECPYCRGCLNEVNECKICTGCGKKFEIAYLDLEKYEIKTGKEQVIEYIRGEKGVGKW